MASMGDVTKTNASYDSQSKDTVQHPGHTSYNTDSKPQGRVVGVYYDKQRRIWRANWREGDVGKRKTKNFSVDDYGFDEARRLAIEYRLMKVAHLTPMESSCPEIDRIRLSTCRAPAQPTSGERSRKRYVTEQKRRARNQKSPSFDGSDVYMSRVIPPPGGEYYDPSDNHGIYWGSYPNQYYGDPMQMWYYNPDMVYSFYQPIGNDQVESLGAPLLNNTVGMETYQELDFPQNISESATNKDVK